MRRYTEDHARSGIKATLPEIECWENQYPDYEIEIVLPEYTAICPRTGLPDFGTLYVTYVPDQWCLELKSLKEYVTAFRNLGIFYENVVNRFLRDVVAAAGPLSATVVGEFTPRGGLHAKVTATWSKKRGARAK